MSARQDGVVRPVKRIEIVADSATATRLLAALDRIGLHDYTVMKEVFGHGTRGDRGGDPFSGTFDNSFILLVVAPDHTERVVEVIGPLLRRFGGICVLSDAAQLES
jgi:nitrogen regulatory protein PII